MGSCCVQSNTAENPPYSKDGEQGDTSPNGKKKKQKKQKEVNMFKTRRGERIEEDEEGRKVKVVYKPLNEKEEDEDQAPAASLATASIMAAQNAQAPKYPQLQPQVREQQNLAVVEKYGNGEEGGPMSFQPMSPNALPLNANKTSEDMNGGGMPVSFGGGVSFGGSNDHLGKPVQVQMTTQQNKPPTQSFRFRNSINDNQQNQPDAYNVDQGFGRQEHGGSFGAIQQEQ